MFVLSVAIRFIIANRFPIHIECYPDELRYYRIAASIANGTGISVYNLQSNFQKILYSLFIVPACFFNDINIRMSIIFLTNSILMSSGVFFVYYISLQIIKKNIYRIIVCFMYLLFGYMTYTMTLISENLWIPFSLFIICLFIKIFQETSTKTSLVISICTGIILYFLYLSKEIALIFPIAYIIFCLLYSFIDKCRYNYFNYRYIVSFSCLALGFILPFFIMKISIFYGLGNSYNQQGIDALYGSDKIHYMYYSIVYFITNIFVMSYLLPVIISALYFDELDNLSKKIYIFITILLVISAITIAYTISIREDYPSLSPRAHTRYVAWLSIIYFILFFSLIEKKIHKNVSTIKKIFIFLPLVIFLPALYRGPSQGSNIDHTMFMLSNLSPNIIFLFTLFVIAMCYMCIYLFEIHKDKIVFLFIVVFIVTQFYDNMNAVNIQYSVYNTSKNEMADVKYIKKFVDSHQDDNFLLFDRFMSKELKIIDTFITEKNVFTTSIDIFKQDLEDVILESRPIESIFTGTYHKMKINYIILKDDFLAIESDNCLKIENIKTIGYNIYKIYDSMRSISIMRNYNIIFFGAKFNASTFINSGISVPENGFTWTDSKEVIFKPIRISEKKCMKSMNMKIIFDGVYNNSQSVIIECNNKIIYNGLVAHDMRSLKVPVTSNTDGIITLKFYFPDAVSPKMLGQSNDSRLLALSLKNIFFE